MAELKTRPTGASFEDYLDAIPDESRRDDCRAVAKLMQKATKAKPVMWGPGIVGFGSYTYAYPNGKTMEWMKVGFASRKTDLTLYLFRGPEHAAQHSLGKYKHGKGCLYIKRLSDVDTKALAKAIESSMADLQEWIDAGQPKVSLLPKKNAPARSRK